MYEFTIAFPLKEPAEQIWQWMQEKQWIAQAPTDHSMMLRGIPLLFQGYAQNKHPILPTLFQEHCEISPDELHLLESHQGILFLKGRFKDHQDFHHVQTVIKTLLEGGALGVVFEHCGAAHLAQHWLEVDSNSISTWLNWIEVKGELRSFGMEIFGLADIALLYQESASADWFDIGEEVADALYIENLPLESGESMEISSGIVLQAQRLSKSPYPSKHPHYNRQGMIQLRPLPTNM